MPGEVYVSTSVSQRAAGNPGLLGQFALGGCRRRLTRHVEQPGRKLPQPLAHRMAVLVQQQDPALVVVATTPTAPGCTTTSRDAVLPPGMTTRSRRTSMIAPS